MSYTVENEVAHFMSGLISRNALRISWSHEEVEERLENIMVDIHAKCVEHGKEEGTDFVNYVKGANIGGFLKMADAMLAYGVA